MKMKLLKKVTFFSFSVILVTTFSLYQINPSANASTPEVATEVIEQKEINQISSLHEKYNPADFTEVAIENEVDEETSLIQPLGVQKEDVLNLAPGRSWRVSFKVDNIIHADHNAFNIKVSNVTSGRYKIMVTGSNGYNYETTEISGNSTLTISNAAKGVTYTAIVVNTSSINLNGKVNVTSYIK